MESTIVIKVNYGNTLRRFSASVDEAGKLKFSFSGLREKVLSLFSLSPEIDLTLTYLDEDGDSVTLADDDDLSDVMRQSLNPLRITATVISERGISNSSARSSESSTPIRSSPKVSQPLPVLNATVSEILKAVPEPIGEAISKLSLDLASKAVASSPQIPELVQQFSKMLQTHMALVSDLQTSKVSATQSAGAESSKQSSITKEPEVSRGDGVKPMGGRAIRIGRKPSTSEKKADPITSTPENNTLIYPGLASVDDRKKEVEKSGGGLNTGAVKPNWENIKAVASSVIGVDDKPISYPVDPNVTWNNSNVPFAGNTSSGPLNQNAVGQCPFSGMPVANDLPYPHFAPRVHPFRRSFSQGGVSGIFHRGVRCDGCGVHPITGPRFKSKVKEDYDLCSICFAEMGSEAEYIRLDRPVSSRNPLPFKGLYDFHARVSPPKLPQALRAVVRPKPKLDSRFIMDVNVADGTMMAPSTPFTKIWRMRNNGTLVWPQQSNLVWIGGDRLGASPSAGLQIPVDGLAVENEIEVAIDFVAPELPGRYVSYWRMASPSGQKFGQRVWVLIQVDASAKDSAHDNNLQGFNLNLLPVSGVVDGAESVVVEPMVVDGRLPIAEPSNIDVERIAVDGRLPIAEPSNIEVERIAVDGRIPISDPSSRATDLVEPLVVPVPTKDQDLNFPINDSLLVNGMTNPFETNPFEMGPSTVSYPTVDSSAVPLVMASLEPPTLSAVGESSAQASGEEDGVEQILLRELEEMGFKQVDLNKEILRKNEYNLEQSVDDLCGVSEWDPILEELQEMGFCDDEVNKKLLKKNNGSIKGVVMDLINGEMA